MNQMIARTIQNLESVLIPFRKCGGTSKKTVINSCGKIISYAYQKRNLSKEIFVLCPVYNCTDPFSLCYTKLRKNIP